jgi:hypothetical protein
MANLFRYLISIAAHLAWQRAGRRGPLPPMKIPGKRTTHLPIPSPWQIMAATWLLERLWKTYGDDVKHKLTHTKSPAVNKLGQMIPAPGDADAPAATSSNVVTAPATVTSTPAPQQMAPKAPGTTYATQRLPQDPLPPGSVLGSLRSP